MINCPLDYSLCAQIVTVYRWQDGRVEKKVLNGCAFSIQQQRSVYPDGARQSTAFSLIVPGFVQQVFPGDRILEGVGPDITPEQWDTFLPVCVPGLCQISFVRTCYWGQEICHIEAGHKESVRQQL